MDDRIDRLEIELGKLVQRIQAMEGRLASLEARAASAEPAAPLSESRPETVQDVPQQAAGGWADATGLLTLAGRFFIVMGGAYLLRALTEASTLSATLGVTLGLVYAAFWGLAAGITAGKGKLWSGTFHGVAAALIAFPLIWEAAARFKILRSPLDAWLLAALAAVFLGIACRYRFQPLAWLAAAGSVVTAGALLLAADSFVPCTLFLIVLGVATLWLGYELEWRGLRWLVAFAANLAVLGLTLRAMAAEPREFPGAALAVQLLLLGLYLASVAVRTLVRARNVIMFEIVQIVACFLLGFIGAIYTTRATGIGTLVLGISALVLAIACYAVAFAFVDRREGRGKNFYFYTSLALLFALTGSSLVLGSAALSIAWVLLAVPMGWLGWRYSRLALVLHATIAIIAAAFASGLLSYALAALAGPASLVGAVPTGAHLIVLAGAAACLAVPLPHELEVRPIWARIQRLAITIVLVGGLGGMIDSVAGRLLGGIPEGGVDPGILATIRTVVLALSALILAWLGKRERFLEWGWLVYPVLAATGVKILLEDFPRSRPATLFVALAAYGCALTFSPRLRRAGSSADIPEREKMPDADSRG